MGLHSNQSTGVEADLPQVFTVSWILWCSSSPDDQASVHEEVDKIFSRGFSFYPELEWRTRYPPPQGHEILGAWRDELNRAFAFLLDNPGMRPPPGTVPLLLHCAGAKVVLDNFLPDIKVLKDDLTEKNGRQKLGKRLQGRLKQADTSKSLRRLMGLMGPITAIINGLALYLRKLPAPTIEVAWFSRLYNLLLASVYSGALLLLLLFIGLCVVYVGKLGYLLIQKL
jgi:hypothetical protein